ncbi:GIY-YIG nuclease family protein [Vibrio gallicus]|uniref:GIY-YIG nuclease family protein n=1 Tax=Vibrio gallicus TaxID=190897 RepID=UPI0021C32DD0|nr:GIY-YIG nuclease family protein [Vibrio gallicus]
MTQKLHSEWSVYLIRTKLNALYCGCTNDVDRRFAQHQSGKGAKALRGKGPLVLEWFESGFDKSTAMKLEYFIKQQPKKFKELLIQGLVSLPEDAA